MKKNAFIWFCLLISQKKKKKRKQIKKYVDKTQGNII